MTFAETAALWKKDRIVLIALRPQNGAMKIVKGRIVGWTETKLTLKGDLDVLNRPEHQNIPPKGSTLRRLEVDETVEISFDEMIDVAWG